MAQRSPSTTLMMTIAAAGAMAQRPTSMMVLAAAASIGTGPVTMPQLHQPPRYRAGKLPWWKRGKATGHKNHRTDGGQKYFGRTPAVLIGANPPPPLVATTNVDRVGRSTGITSGRQRRLAKRRERLMAMTPADRDAATSRQRIGAMRNAFAQAGCTPLSRRQERALDRAAECD